MAVNSASNRVDAVGTGAQTAFPYTFNVYTASDLQVYVAGVLKTINTDYTQTAVNVPGGIIGGTVNFVVAPGNGVAILLLRVLPYTQATQFTNLDKFDAKSAVEGTFDKGVMQTQQLVEKVGRAVHVPVTSLLTDVLMSDPSLPANYGLGLKIKADGTGIDTFTIAQGGSIVTTKGDLLTYGVIPDRLPVSSNGLVLVSDSTQPTGIKWSGTVGAGGVFTCATGLHVDSSTTLTGALDISSSGASAGKIFFPSTQISSVSVNCLDDYREGTWTPSVGGSATYNLQLGTYTKIGNIVTLYCLLSINVLGTGSTNVITGIPAIISPAAAGIGVCNWTSIASSIVYAAARLNGTSITIVSLLAAGATLGNNAIFGNNASVEISMSYLTAT